MEKTNGLTQFVKQRFGRNIQAHQILKPIKGQFSPYPEQLHEKLKFILTEQGIDQLYDHQSDPKEMTNLANKPQHAKTVAQLSKRIRARIKEARTAPAGVKQIIVKNRRKRKKKK